MWRWTGARVGVLGMDAACLLPMLVFLLHWAWWTFYVAAAGTVFFAALSFFGYTPIALCRRARCWWVGKDRHGTPQHKRSFYA